jgi:DNA invertase Pin-like site-specific DNA recombinase
MVAEFEVDLGRLRIREGMALAKRQGKLKGEQPKLPESAAVDPPPLRHRRSLPRGAGPPNFPSTI